MQGLIQEQMASPAEQMPQAEDENAEMQGVPMGEAEESEELDESNPAFQTALRLAKEAMYKNNAAADIAKSLKSAPSAVEGLSNTAYELVSIVDERTDGQVPDELLVLLAVSILQEVADIGEAAGVDVSPANVAEAFKQMLLRFLGEQGADTTQLQQAMDQVDPSVFDKAANAEA